jgi:hypothetical protein
VGARRTGEGALGNANTARLAVLAAVAALVTTGLMHLLLVSTPRPFRFFTWIVSLLTLVAALAPFMTDAKLATQVATAAIYLVTGLAIGSLVSGRPGARSGSAGRARGSRSARVTASTAGGDGGQLQGEVGPAEWGGHRIPTVDRFPGLHLPDWFQTLGRGTWLLVGIAVLLAIAFFLLGLISDLVIPLVFAAILAAIFVPLVDRLERWCLPRWLAAPWSSTSASRRRSPGPASCRPPAPPCARPGRPSRPRVTGPSAGAGSIRRPWPGCSGAPADRSGGAAGDLTAPRQPRMGLGAARFGGVPDIRG